MDTKFAVVGNLRAYGSTAFVYDHSVARGDKLAPRAKNGTLELDLKVIKSTESG